MMPSQQLTRAPSSRWKAPYVSWGVSPTAQQLRIREREVVVDHTSLGVQGGSTEVLSEAVCEASHPSGPGASRAESTRDLDEVLAAIDAEPFEDGMSHPAELRVSEYIRRHGDSTIADVVIGATDKAAPGIAVLIRLLARHTAISLATRLDIVSAGLASRNIEVRDAAAQAAEIWENPELAPILASHHERAPWLADYIASVARDLAR
jgi:hypothetical protein